MILFILEVSAHTALPLSLRFYRADYSRGNLRPFFEGRERALFSGRAFGRARMEPLDKRTLFPAGLYAEKTGPGGRVIYVAVP
jgi:hypothetical protein